MFYALYSGWNLVVLNVPHKVIATATQMSDTEWALNNSMLCFGGMCGALSAGLFQDRFGRKLLSCGLNIHIECSYICFSMNEPMNSFQIGTSFLPPTSFTEHY